MVNLSVIEQEIKDDPNVSESFKQNVMPADEYKDKVLFVKKTVQKMMDVGEEKGIPFGKIDRDIKELLLNNGLTSFDLRTNGERKNGAQLEAFLHGFNTKIKDIAKIIVPELVPTSFMLSPFDPEFLEKDKARKKSIEDMLENLFTQDIPGVGKIIDQKFTPESLGERMADQAGESLVEFLPMMIGMPLLASQGPIQGFRTAVTQNPNLKQKVFDVLNNSGRTILDTYIKTPGKAFVADIAASMGFGAGEQFGKEELRTSADETASVGYQDTPGLVETASGLTGATIGVALTNPIKTAIAIPKFLTGGGPLVKKLIASFKDSKEKKAADFFRPILESSEKEMIAAKDLQSNVITGQTYGPSKPLKLTTAEETLSPGISAQQAEIEARVTGAEIDKVVKRRIDNINAMDETLSNVVPKTDKDFTIFIDKRQNTIKPIVKKLDDQINVVETKAKEITESIKPKTSKDKSGQAIRNEIETKQFEGAAGAVEALNKIPAANQIAETKVLENLSALNAREFETGTQPVILDKINKKINQYLPKEEKIDTVSFNPNTKKIEKNIETTIIPPTKELKNQDLFDIWLSASMEETKLIGNAGIDAANKLQRISEIKGTVFKALQKNLTNVEGGPKFFDELNTYIKKFEEGVIVQLRNQNPAGHQIQNEAVADSFFQGNNVEAMKKFINVFGENPNAVANMKDAILDRLANKSINPKTDLINVNDYKQFLARYDSALKELATIEPAFVESLNKTPSAFGALSERLATLNKRKAFVQGDKLKTTLSIFGSGSKQFNFGSVDEYVNAALADSKLMSNLTERIMKADAGESWVKAITEKFTTLRINPKSAQRGISPNEIKSMENFLETNEQSLKTLYSTMGKGYEKHFDNLKIIVNGFERVNFVPLPKGVGAQTPAEQMREALGVGTPQIWSRAFAVASNRTGWKFVAMETLNRFLNTAGLNHFDKVIKKATNDPEFAKTLVKMVDGKEATVKDFQNLYGFLAKINGTIGSVSSDSGTNDVTMEDEADAAEQIKEPKADVTKQIKKEVEQGFNVRPDENSRLSNVNIANPVGIRPSPVDPGTSGTDIASINPNTRAKGVEIFGADDAIFGMAQGGIMNARKQIQRVA